MNISKGLAALSIAAIALTGCSASNNVEAKKPVKVVVTPSPTPVPTEEPYVIPTGKPGFPGDQNELPPQPPTT